ncbi:hypothetical protein ACF07Y_36500 [Streptomyces sp. NPDC016566]|uniref:hypothetical protein n=1 Tax=Streptomyces sp. NPDC016566 TaxID=3364967 RepID=UPI0036FEBFB4
MGRFMKWGVVVLAAAVVFTVAYGVARLDPLDWLPQKDSDAVAVAAAFAGVVAAAVVAAGGWWASDAGAGRGTSSGSVRQRARASDRARIVQEHGQEAPGEVRQRAEGSGDSEIRQSRGRGATE